MADKKSRHNQLNSIIFSHISDLDESLTDFYLVGRGQPKTMQDNAQKQISFLAISKGVRYNAGRMKMEICKGIEVNKIEVLFDAAGPSSCDN